MALSSDGTLATWGLNGNGQLGKGKTLPTEVTIAGTLLAGKTFTSIGAAGSTSIVLCSDGSVIAWGHTPGGTVTSDNGALPGAAHEPRFMLWQTRDREGQCSGRQHSQR
jgi:alpha-tubulin suppressor-like RCC1 family protein